MKKTELLTALLSTINLLTALRQMASMMILLWKSTRVHTYVDFHLCYTAERSYCSLQVLLVLLLLLILEKTQCYCYCVGGAAALAQMLVVLSDALTASAIVRDVPPQLSYTWQLRDINEAKNKKC
jgi:hypothetical protein